MQVSNLKRQNSLPTIERLLTLGIKLGIFLTLLTPLITSKLGIFPIISSKANYFYVLVEITFLLYIFLLLLERRYLPRISPIFISLLFFIEVLAFSVVKSINPMRSFWGSMERMEGLILPLHLFIFFIILIGVFSQKKDWLNLLRFTVLVSVPLGLVGSGLIYFFNNPGSPRIEATLGNPVFYGNYLTLIIFLSLFLIISEKNKKLKILFVSTTIYNLFLLILTGTRGAWAGMALGGFFLIFVWFLFFYTRQKEKRKILLFSVFIFFLLCLLFVTLTAGYFSKVNFLGRVESVFDSLIEFKDSRIYVWRLGIDAWKDNFLFGYGLDSFAYIYDKYYQANLLEAIRETIFFDRAHNKIVDTLVANGIVGLLSYLAVFATTLFVISKNYKEKFKSFLPFVLIAFFLGHFTQNIFAFDTINTYIILFLVLGFVDVSFKKEGDSQDKEQENRSNTSIQTRVFLSKIGVACLAFLLIAFIIFTINIQPFVAKVQLTEGSKLLTYGGPEKASQAFQLIDKALNGPQFTRHEIYYYASEIVFRAAPLPQHKGIGREFSQELQKIVQPWESYLEGKKEILQMRSYLLLAEIYKNLYLVENDPKFLKDEERILGKAIRLNPQFPKIYRLSGEMRFLQNRKDEGMTLFAKAFELDQNWANFYVWLGKSFMQIGEKRKGVDALRESYKLGDFYTKDRFSFETVGEITKIYKADDDSQELARFYEEVITYYPFDPYEKRDNRHAQLYASLSVVYAEIGEKEKARQTTTEMLKLYPDLLPEAQQFLSTLEEE